MFSIRKTAKVLATHYKKMDNLINTTEEDLIKIPDIGDVIAKSVIDYFNNSFNASFTCSSIVFVLSTFGTTLLIS